jgi:hypothetical protein
VGEDTVIHIVIGENGKRHRLRSVESLVESAKWNMYAELWKTAQDELEEARIRAVYVRDKHVIDEILMLLAKCEDKEKPEINS